jgi:hypothetical protein
VSNSFSRKLSVTAATRGRPINRAANTMSDDTRRAPYP